MLKLISVNKFLLLFVVHIQTYKNDASTLQNALYIRRNLLKLRESFHHSGCMVWPQGIQHLMEVLPSKGQPFGCLHQKCVLTVNYILVIRNLSPGICYGKDKVQLCWKAARPKLVYYTQRGGECKV